MKKMKNKGYKAGGKMKAKGGPIRKMKKGMKVKGYAAGGLKDVPEDNKGLGKLPQKVRNNMGFKAKGGTIKKMAEGKKVEGKMMRKGRNDPTKRKPKLKKPTETRAPNMNMMVPPLPKGMPMQMAANGGMMKTKGGTKRMMAKGGTIRKMKGGKMVTKGGTKGGAKGGKAKVRGAGIAQRGVRPAKMR